MQWRTAWIVGGLCLALGACEVDDSDDDMAGTETLDPSGDDSMADSSGAAAGEFAPIQAILSGNCSCHMAGTGGLSFGGDAYAALVGVTASGSDLAYVEPGDVGQSYLIHKLRGTQGPVGAGEQMPLGGMLTEDQIGTIEDWIADGAPE